MPILGETCYSPDWRGRYFTVNTLVGTIASLVIGGAVASVTLVTVVTSQTSSGDRSPVDSTNVEVQYGEN